MPDKITGPAGSADIAGIGGHAVGKTAHAEGFGVTATGDHSHAEGNQATAAGTASHAEGFATGAGGVNSHAEGNSSSTGVSASAAHAEGLSTAANGANSHAEGSSSIASGNASHAEGNGCQATALGAHAEGSQCIAGGTASHAEGFYGRTSRYAQHAHGGGLLSSTGDAQAIRMVLGQITTDATPTPLTTNITTVDASGSASTNVLTVGTNRAFRFRAEAAARRSDVVGAFAGWTITGTLVRDTGNVRFISAPVVTVDADAAAGAWTLAASVDTANQCLQLTATGEAGKSIHWVAALYATEVG